MQTSPLKFLPIILAVLALGSAAFLFSQRQAVKEKINKVYTKLPEPTVFIPFKRYQDQIVANITPTPTPTPVQTPIPNASDLSDKSKSSDSSKKVAATTKTVTRTSTTIICTPVYGMANSCAEHTVVDTGLETSAFTNLAALSYIGGLVAFIKSKRKV